jgi:hypothetical protein
MHDEVILEGSVFANPIAGREAVRNAMRQSSSIYDRLEFTHQTQSTDRTYFLWEGTALGLPLWGVTAIAVGVDGRVRVWCSAIVHLTSCSSSRRPWPTASSRTRQPTSSLACPPAFIR